eukprot:3506077-Prymnesium_polylepis.1
MTLVSELSDSMKYAACTRRERAAVSSSSSKLMHKQMLRACGRCAHELQQHRAGACMRDSWWVRYLRRKERQQQQWRGGRGEHQSSLGLEGRACDVTSTREAVMSELE